MDAKQVEALQVFTDACKKNPQILHLPELKFYKEWLESLGAKLPEPQVQQESAPKTESPMAEDEESEEELPDIEPEPEPEPESEESDVELDNSGVVEDEDKESPEYGDESIELTDEMIEAASDKRGQAMDAFAEGRYDDALKLYTEAIKGNPTSSIMYAKRAGYVEAWKRDDYSTLVKKTGNFMVFMKMDKPNKAILDCNKALVFNPDSSQAYKCRGKANRLLGHWEEAYKDLTQACKIDYDEDANSLLKEVTPNADLVNLLGKGSTDSEDQSHQSQVLQAKKIMEHRRKYDRKREEKELKERQERVKKARENYEKQKQNQSSGAGAAGGFPGGFPFGMPGGMGGMPGGMGGMPGAGGGMPGGAGGMPGSTYMPGQGMPGAGGMPGMPDMSALFSDPEILEALQDPEVSAAFQDVSQNPANIAKYQTNPKVQAVINKLSKKFGGSGAAPGGNGP